MSDRQIEKFRIRIENRLEEVQKRIYDFGLKRVWDALDRYEYESLLKEASSLKRQLIKIG